MPEEITFTTATFGGFEKKQVLDYIYKMHEEADEERAQHRKRLEEISVAYKDLENRAVTAENKAVTLEKKLSSVENDHQQEVENHQRTQEEKAQLQEKIQQYERVLAGRQQEPAPAPAPPPPAKSTPAEYQQMEESSAQIGRVMLDAHTKADNIVSQAKKDANRIIAQAQDAIEKQRTQTNTIVQNHQKKVQAESQSRLDTAQEQADEILAHAQDKADQLTASVESLAKKAAEQLQRLDYQIGKLNESTAGTIHDIQQSAPAPTASTTPQPDTADDPSQSWQDYLPRSTTADAPPEDTPYTLPDTQELDLLLPDFNGHSEDTPLSPEPSPTPTNEAPSTQEFHFEERSEEETSPDDPFASLTFPSLDPPDFD